VRRHEVAAWRTSGSGRRNTPEDIVEQTIHLAVEGHKGILAEAALGQTTRPEWGEWLARHRFLLG